MNDDWMPQLGEIEAAILDARYGTAIELVSDEDQEEVHREALAIQALIGGAPRETVRRQVAVEAGEEIAQAIEDEWRKARPEYQAGLFVAIKIAREKRVES